MQKNLRATVLAMLLTLAAQAIAGQALAQTTAADQPARTLFLTLEISRKPAADAQPIVLAQPTLGTTAGRPFSFKSGGKIKRAPGQQTVETGAQYSGKITRTANGRLHVALQIRISKLVPQKDDPQTSVLQTEAYDIRTTLPPGGAKRLTCSPTTWCTIRVAEAD